MLEFDWQPIRLVVFDVDGTLYDQRQMRFKMIQELVGHCLRHPGDLGVLRVISRFRQAREELAEAGAKGIVDLQYRMPAQALGVEPAEVRRTVEEWILQRPLQHLRSCRYAKVAEFMAELRSTGRIVGVYSDYPALEKLEALELEADLTVSALDPEVDRLKPHPRGLQKILELAGVEAAAAVLIGDRDDRDGECARRADVACLLKTTKAAGQGAGFQDFGDLVRSLHSVAAEDAALQ